MAHFSSSNQHFHRKKSIYIKKKEYNNSAFKFVENKSDSNNLFFVRFERYGYNFYK
ncbi:hypothetical protein LEP1GSC191_0480 [Leptospira borgpetersenii serovar Mini str. 201000851]|uniref:Uncharacterized protein n=1 Tax=Leptospira borgpetersenii str. 200801926 TaxID=1193009 RepID=A0ABP2SAY5_LEPBO|nr:hypothetical protein LEP1GSC128_1969 [Leptospira borgpetersenii str. 200801926]EMN58359.1 hypothetical protein LEP1GSC090_3138 [Leptospira borgpetersenii serovar Javanica str. MK146]ENO62721.1 hypothetical protein LEP1GSC191_0480 [Leptospira borgpetersenii serovar Mini str. 201000851]